jgi:hypothetical protein
LAGQFGLRKFFATTTDFRDYYDQLPSNPLDGESAASKIAIEAWERATEGPWSEPLDDALERTAEIASIVGWLADEKSLWSKTQTAAWSETPSTLESET